MVLVEVRRRRVHPHVVVLWGVGVGDVGGQGVGNGLGWKAGRAKLVGSDARCKTHLVDALPLLDPEARAGGGVVGPRVNVEEDEELLRVVDGRVELLL